MKNRSISIVLAKVIVIFVFTSSLLSCGGSGGGGGDGDGESNVGSVTITEPTTFEVYEVRNQTSIEIEGEAFISPDAHTKEGKACNCAGLACLIYIDYVECVDYVVYDSGVTVTAENLSTGETVTKKISSLDGYTTHWLIDIPLVPNENVIKVRAEDNLNNWAKDEITINVADTIPPEVVSKTPQYGSVDIYSTIQVVFSEVIDKSTVTSDSFTVNN
ncbi:MAG: hypothetical protein JRD88_11925 [Deltaproteobacteria bacterium]|jgi:hypothetical protein|nr:hypothetical protein [Deltaproteobacteria bacterium]